MDLHLQGLDRLETKMDRLKREYDLFLAGRRRGEPVALRDEVQRDVLALTRHPWPSTAARFRARTLAHRFQALEVQVRHLAEMRAARKAKAEPEPPEAAEVLFDRACLEEGALLERYVQRLHRSVARLVPAGALPDPAVLRQRIETEVRRLLQEPGVAGVRFRVEAGERGARIRGEVVRAPPPRPPVPQPAQPGPAPAPARRAAERG